MINVSVEEFQNKWYLADKGEELYTNGSFQGEIVYEDERYFVIKLLK